MDLKQIVLSAIDEGKYRSLNNAWYASPMKDTNYSFCEIEDTLHYDTFQDLLKEFSASEIAFRVNFYQHEGNGRFRPGWKKYHLTETVEEKGMLVVRRKAEIPELQLQRIADAAEEDAPKGFIELYGATDDMLSARPDRSIDWVNLLILKAKKTPQGVVIYDIKMRDNMLDRFTWKAPAIWLGPDTRYSAILDQERFFYRNVGKRT
ncbi:MAG: hypothetical protein GXP63_04215 [DPANN group archaeon]|nr:hypothetical protein [DPANN group archaeon]